MHCQAEVLQTVTSVKYLGLHLDSNFSWTTHIDHLNNKICCQATACLWRYRNCFTRTARRTWYVSIVQSSLVYTSNAFFPSLSMSSRQRISTLAKAAIRAVCQVHIPASTWYISATTAAGSARCGADHDEENIDVRVPVCVCTLRLVVSWYPCSLSHRTLLSPMSQPGGFDQQSYCPISSWAIRSPLHPLPSFHCMELLHTCAENTRGKKITPRTSD